MREYKLDSGFNLKIFVVTLSVLFLVSYGVFNARKMIMGPSITIWSPPSAEIETNENTVNIKGEVKNVNFLKVNGRTMTLDTEGRFDEKLLLSPGFNIIEIVATDRFKKEDKKTLKIFYQKTEEESDSQINMNKEMSSEQNKELNIN